MVMPARSPNFIASMRARRLARTLKEFREAAKLSQAAVGASLEWSQQKVTAIETLRNGVSVEDVAAMLELYGVASPEKDAVLSLARDANRRSWWTEYGDFFEGSYVALEDAATRMLVWELYLVPGIVQTMDYARAVISAGGRFKDPVEIERRLRARMQRQAILTRSEPPELHIVLDESVLHRPVGGVDVLAAQLRQLVAEARRENVTIQVMPHTTAGHPGLDGGFMVFHFAKPDPDVGYCEGRFGAAYLESPHQVARCNVAFEEIRKVALTPQESVALIGATAAKL